MSDTIAEERLVKRNHVLEWVKEASLNESSKANNRSVALLQFESGPAPSGNDIVTITSRPLLHATVGTLYTYQIVATESAGKELGYTMLYGPSGAQLDPDTGLLTWTVNVPAGTRVSFTVGAVNDNADANGQAWSVDVVDAGTVFPPTIASVPTSAATVGLPYVYGLEGSDPDGGTVTFTLVSAPNGMTLSSTTNLISWTPGTADVGEKIVRVVATDSQGQTTQQEWTVVVDPVSSLKPDLVPVAIDLTQCATDAQSLHRDGAAVVTVANQGTGSAGAFSVIVYEDRDGVAGYSASADVLLGTGTGTATTAGQRQDVVVPVSGQTLFRDNRIAVYVDPDNEVAESREDNNGDFSGNGTRFVPVPGALRISTKWSIDRGSWGGYGYPLMVGQLTDDNGDGRIDGKDIPIEPRCRSAGPCVRPAAIPARA